MEIKRNKHANVHLGENPYDIVEKEVPLCIICGMVAVDGHDEICPGCQETEELLQSKQKSKI